MKTLKLIRFAKYTLETLACSSTWSALTFELIADKARELDLATVRGAGEFVALVETTDAAITR